MMPFHVGQFFVLLLLVSSALGDDILYRYEGDSLPYDASAGWIIADSCQSPWCMEAITSSHFKLQWTGGDVVNYHYWIAQPPVQPPLTLWVEWQFRSNTSMLAPGDSYICDARFNVTHRQASDDVYIHGNALLNSSADYVISGLSPNEFHTFRYENADGLHYHFSVDGKILHEETGIGDNGGYSYLQFGGCGDCNTQAVPIRTNEWDYIRFGTLASGETIISSDPPGGYLDPNQYTGLDRLNVTFNQPAYIYINDITVEVSGGSLPAVTKTWRLDTQGPETLQVVLDRPLTVGQTTRFTFNTGGTPQVVQYTLTDPIPAQSHFGLIVTGSALVCAGMIILRRHRPALHD